MKNITIITIQHPQNKKDVRGIQILNKQFVLSDKRGLSTYANVAIDFANEVIKSFEVEKGKSNLNLFYPERLQHTNNLRLSWLLLGENKVQLRIHNGSSHIWTSKVIKY